MVKRVTEVVGTFGMMQAYKLEYVMEGMIWHFHRDADESCTSL